MFNGRRFAMRRGGIPVGMTKMNHRRNYEKITSEMPQSHNGQQLYRLMPHVATNNESI